jgi:WD40 repeat protein
MPQRLRVFVSSPGDVPDERLRAALIVDKLSQDYGRFFTIETYRWEHEALLASKHFQDAIDPPSAFDIVVLILWSRLGTPLPEKTAEREYRGIDGRVPVTGTEWEYEEALKAARERHAPDLLAFRNTSPAPIDSRDPDAQDRSIAQLRALNAFWTRHFADRGVFLAAYDEYRALDEFALRLEESLRKLIERRIKQLVGADKRDEAIWLGEPFRGLESYEFEHAPIFFGRDAAITKATEQLAANARSGSAFLLVSGASGSGKSSLVKAGIAPRLMKPQRISGMAFIRRAVFRPGAEGVDVILGLANALTRPSENKDIGLPELLGPGQDAGELAAHLRSAAGDPSYPFVNTLGHLTEAGRAVGRLLAVEDAKLILIVDQLEELFTAPGIAPEDRQLLVRLLAGLAGSGSVWVIGTVRADFWHRLAEIPELTLLAEGRGRVDLAPASPAELAEMIRKPAQASGLSFEVHPETGIGLDAVLAQDAAAAPGALPLLSFTLDELYKNAKARGESVLTYASYEALGGLEGAIAKRADEVVACLPAAAQAALPRALRALATVGGIGDQAPVACAARLATFPEDSPARTLIDAFIAARLLVAASEGGTRAEATVRLAHEALISRWQRASEQLAADRRDLETRALLEQQLGRWRQAHGAARRQLLIRDPDLANAIDLAKRWSDELDAGTRAFIQTSYRRAQLQHRLLLGAVAVFALLTLSASAFGGLFYFSEKQARESEKQAVLERNHARESEARAVLSEAQAVQSETQAVQSEKKAVESQRHAVESDINHLAASSQQLASAGRTELAAALALDALQTGQNQSISSPDVDAAIHRTLSLIKVPAERFLGENVFNLAISPDGHTLAAGTVKGMVYVLDPGTLEVRFQFLAGDDVVSGLDFSPDGRRLVVAGDKIPSVWDVQTGRKLFDLQRKDARKFTKRAQFSPDGKFIAIGGSENRALIYDAATGQLLHELPGASYEEMRDRLRKQSGNKAEDFDPIVDAVARANWMIWGAATDAIFSPDGKMIAVAGPANPDGSVRLFDAATGKLLKTLSGGYGTMWTPPLNYGQTLAFSPDGSSIVAAMLEKVIKVWNVKDGQLRAEFPVTGGNGGINSLVLTSDGQAAVTAQENGSLIFRCLAQNSAVFSVQAHEAAIESLSADSTGSILATGSRDRTARVWSMPTGAEICGLDPKISMLRPAAILTGHGGRISKTVFSDSNRLLTTASQDGWVRTFAISPADALSVPLPAVANPFRGWENVFASADERTIFAYNGDEDHWHGWDLTNGHAVEIPEDVGAIAPGDKSQGAILFQSPLLHFPLDKPPPPPPPPPNELFAPSFSIWQGPVSADGSRVVADEDSLRDNSSNDDHPPPLISDKIGADDKPLVLIDADTKQILAHLAVDGQKAQDLFFSLDGTRLFGTIVGAAKSDDKKPGIGVAAWDARTGNLIATIPTIDSYDPSAPTVASRDGSRLLISQSILFSVGDGGFKPVKVPDVVSSSESPVTKLVLSANGVYLAAARKDGTIVVADIDRNTLWRVLDTNRLPITSVAMSSDGRYLAAADTSNTLWVFDIDAGELVRSETLLPGISAIQFLSDSENFAVRDNFGLTILPALPSFAGQSDVPRIASSADKLGLNVLSEEDRRRFNLGGSAAPSDPNGEKWAAIAPYNDGTAPVAWGDSEAEAKAKATAACRQLSTTCASSPAATSNLDATFVYMCCTKPKVGCAVASGLGATPVLSVKTILAQHNYSECEVRGTFSARDGSPR